MIQLYEIWEMDDSHQRRMASHLTQAEGERVMQYMQKDGKPLPENIFLLEAELVQ